MIVRLRKTFHFEASHQLTNLPPEHSCHRLHGHGYRVEIEVSGEVNPATGFLIDYHDLKHAVQPLIDKLDHQHLNDIDGLGTTSAEHIARWIWDQLKPRLPILSAVILHETESTCCEYRGE